MSTPTLGPGRGPVTIAELSAGLLWPRLLRAAPMSLAPVRLTLGFLAAALAAALLTLLDRLRAAPISSPVLGERAGVGEALLAGWTAHAADLAAGMLSLDTVRVALALRGGLYDLPAALLDVQPVTTVAALLLLVMVGSFFGAAIARSAACDIAWRIHTPLAAALGAARRTWLAAFGAVLGPLALSAIVAALLMLAGLALLTIPWIDVVGALLYPVALAGGVVIVFIGVCHALGAPLLVPAVAIEGTDVLDAVQRAYAYVLNRPLRFLLYALLLLAVWAAAYCALSMGVAAAINVASWATGLLNGPGDIGGGVVPFVWERTPEAVESARGTGAAQWIVRFWEGALVLVVAGFVVSYTFTAGAMLYLLMRRINDEQDIEDVAELDPPRPGGAASA